MHLSKTEDGIKYAMDRPSFQGEKGPNCPDCGGCLVGRKGSDGKLYFGCTNYRSYCRFKGCRSY
jgi:hypothetical protein